MKEPAITFLHSNHSQTVPHCHIAGYGGSQPSHRDLIRRNLLLQRLRRLFRRGDMILSLKACILYNLHLQFVFICLCTVATIAQEEGLISLWKGIIPGLHRQFIYGGLRISLYEPVKAFCAGGNILVEVSLFQKIVAALITGAIAITLANPTDLVKVRLQAEGKLPPGAPRRYTGALNAYYTILKEDGLVALWTGLGPNIARNATVNAAELASYDHVKQVIVDTLDQSFCSIPDGSNFHVWGSNPRYRKVLRFLQQHIEINPDKSPASASSFLFILLVDL
ncbi:hypothetical protein L1987_50928 [Smallanthus sonchifolius]|uniref:Uncharacterized protein n=1 Tax=Smallanthus sonchifolius TaxID=185202 RepID=A0ACB9EPN8_9ASTR|nr:hypothetical protein L1987_50928 [Smallanthus sonchifolius]